MNNLQNAGQLIRTVQKYIISDKKDHTILDRIIPGSQQHIYLRGLQILHSETAYQKLSKKDRQHLEQIMASSDYHFEGLKLRIMFKMFDSKKDWKTLKKKWQERTGTYFDSIQEPHFLKDMGVKLASKEIANPTILNIQFDQTQLFDDFYKGYIDLTRIHSVFRRKLDFTKFMKQKNEQNSSPQTWLRAMPNHQLIDYDNKSFYTAFEQHFKKQANDNTHTNLSINKLTIQQLQKLIKLHQNNLKDDVMVSLLFKKTFQISGVLQGLQNQEFNLKEQRQRLKDMLQFLKRFPDKKFQPFRTNVLYELLHNGMCIGEYDKQYFLEYLKNPLGELNSHSIVSKNYIYGNTGSIEQRNCLQKMKKKWRHNDYSQTAINQDKKMIKRYLQYFFLLGQNLSTFTPYFQKNSIQLIEKLAKFTSGKEVKLEKGEYSKFEEVSREVHIEFLPTNKEEFLPNQNVELQLRIKNVSQLLVRVFEINTENYYRQNMAPFRSDINLEGLIPAEEQLIDYNQPPQVIHEQKFLLKELSNKVGLFVIEFIGNGVSSRAVIKKGNLTLVHQPSIAGHIAYVINQSREICTSKESTGIFFDNKFFAADPNSGKIIIPYSHNETNGKAVVLHEGFAALTDFKRLAENYQLSVAFLLSDQAFVMGNKARVLVRPTLHCNGRQADLRLLKNISIQIETYNSIDSVPTTKTFQGLQLGNKDKNSSNNSELSVEFQVSAKLDYVKIEMRADVENSSKGDTVKCSQVLRKDINLDYQNKVHFVEAYLRLSKQSDYELLVLGKNGEPQKGITVTITAKHRFFQNSKKQSCQTDEWGIVILGKLTNIQWVEVFIPDSSTRISVRRRWILPVKLAIQRPKFVEILQGQYYDLPVEMNQLSTDQVAFYRVNSSQEPLIDDFKALSLEKPMKANFDSFKILKFNNLVAGEYRLLLKEQNEKIMIKVYKGEIWTDNSFIMTKQILRERQALSKPLTLSSIEQKGQDVSLSILGADNNTFVHFIALNFLPHCVNQSFFDFSELKPNKLLSSITFSKWKNFYLNSRALSDEFRYVLDRTHCPVGTGNFLEKPTLLMMRQEIRNTAFDSNQLARGQALQVQDQILGQTNLHSSTREFSKSYGLSRQPGRDKNSQRINFLQQFLALPAAQVFGVQPDKQGRVKATIPGLDKSYSSLVVLAVNKNSVAQAVQPLMKCKFPQRDLSLQKNFDVEKTFTEVRNVSSLLKHDSYIIDDITSTQLSLVDSQQNLFSVMKEICRLTYSDKSGLQEFSFLRNWNRLKFSDKKSKFSSFVCNELNLFIKMKDIKFFDRVVRDYLWNKMEKTFFDHWLIDDHQGIMIYLHQIYKFEQLNSLEMTLLAIYLTQVGKKDAAASIAQKLKRWADQYKLNVGQMNKRFDCVIKLNELAKPEDDEFNQILEEEKKMKMEGKDQSYRDLGKSQESEGYDSDRSYQSDQQQRAYHDGYSDSSYEGGGGGGGGGRGRRGSNTYSEVALSASYNCQNDSELMMDQMQQQDYRPRKKAKKKRKLAGKRAFHNTQEELHGLRAKQREQTAYYDQSTSTMQYAQTHYWNNKSVATEVSKYIVYPSQFWANAAHYAVTNKGSMIGFTDKNFIFFRQNSFASWAGVLALLDLPEKAGSHGLRANQGRKLEINAANNLLLFVKEVRETEKALQTNIMVVQRYFDLANSSQEREIEDFLINRAYGCEVILTNVSSREQSFTVLVQIPQGSLPLKKTQFQKSQPFTISPYSTQRFDFQFYFPAPGEFQHFPANIAKDQMVVARAPVRRLKVVESRKVTGLLTFADVLASGRQDAIFDFLRTKNLQNCEQGFNFFSIHYLMKNSKKFWEQCIKIFKNRMIFDKTTWAFGIYYQNQEITQELFQNQKELKKQIGTYFDSSLITVTKQDVGKRFLDFYPLFNARVHKVGADDRCNILNRQFRVQYVDFIFSLLQKKDLNDIDRIQFSNYLILQDRNHQAYTVFERVDYENFVQVNQMRVKKSGKSDQDRSQVMSSTLRIQVDYLRSYFDFLFGQETNFQIARKMSDRYKRYPVVTWRLLFFDIYEQLKEYDGIQNQEDDSQLDEQEAAEKAEDEKRREAKKKALKKEAVLNFNVVGQNLEFQTKNIAQVVVKYYFVDLQVLFSREPFLSKNTGTKQFSFVKPAQIDKFTIKEEEIAKNNNDSSAFEQSKQNENSHNNNLENMSRNMFEIPQLFQKKNVVIQASAGGKKEFQTYFSTSLKVSVIQNYGEIKVTNQEGRMLPGVYTKVFAKFVNGQVKFYKDGYTDMRGKFDYAQLSGATLNSVQRFALFVTHQKYGALTREAAPPAGVSGAIAGISQERAKDQKKWGGQVMTNHKVSRYMRKGSWQQCEEEEE